MLASSDYEGTITLWDAFTGQTSKIYQVSKVMSDNNFCKVDNLLTTFYLHDFLLVIIVLVSENHINGVMVSDLP